MVKLLELYACSELPCGCARSVVHEVGACPLRGISLILGEYERVRHGAIYSELLASYLRQPALRQRIAQRDVFHFHERTVGDGVRVREPVCCSQSAVSASVVREWIVAVVCRFLLYRVDERTLGVHAVAAQQCSCRDVPVHVELVASSVVDAQIALVEV